MIRYYLQILLILVLVLTVGCAHKYSQSQYEALVKQADECAKNLQKSKEENETSSRNTGEIQKKLDKTSQELAAALIDKQELLDKNIQCLEEKKILIKQISQSSSLSQEKKEAQQRMSKGYEQISSLLEADRLNDQLYIIKAPDKIRIVIPQRSLFPTPGSAWLTPKGVKLIKKIAGGLKTLSPSDIQIAGHTDGTFTQETKVNYATNWHLAQARALSVLTVLEESRVKRDTLSSSSYGDTRPIADATSDAGKAINRRVEIIITP